MATNGRSAEEIRRQISVERAQLTEAIAALREDVHSARRIPMIIGGALLAGVTTFAVVKAFRKRGK